MQNVKEYGNRQNERYGVAASTTCIVFGRSQIRFPVQFPRHSWEIPIHLSRQVQGQSF